MTPSSFYPQRISLPRNDLWTFSTDNKIYAAWLEEDLPSWSELDWTDATGTGLSGKREGFYFGNRMFPFQAPFTMQSVFISYENHPLCVNQKTPSLGDQNCQPCDQCTFFSKISCPLLEDQDNFKLSQYGFYIYTNLLYHPRGKNIKLFEVARTELLSHGRPLHYQWLAKIIQDRHPNLAVTGTKLHKVLRINTLYFDEVDKNVFQARKGIHCSYKDIKSLWMGLFEWEDFNF